MVHPRSAPNLVKTKFKYRNPKRAVPRKKYGLMEAWNLISDRVELIADAAVAYLRGEFLEDNSFFKSFVKGGIYYSGQLPIFYIDRDDVIQDAFIEMIPIVKYYNSRQPDFRGKSYFERVLFWKLRTKFLRLRKEVRKDRIYFDISYEMPEKTIPMLSHPECYFDMKKHSIQDVNMFHKMAELDSFKGVGKALLHMEYNAKFYRAREIMESLTPSEESCS